MPTPEPPQHRFARAAGKATRSFLDTSKADAERITAKRAEDSERSAERLAARQADQRANQRADRQADHQADRQAAPTTLVKVTRWWWSAVTVLFAALAVVFLLAGLGAGPDAPGGLDLAAPTASPVGQFVLAGLSGVLALATGTGTVQLLLRRRGAVGLLTGVALIAGIPLIVRGHPLLITLAAVLLAGAALLWLPGVRRSLR